MNSSNLSSRLGSYETYLGEDFTQVAEGIAKMINPIGATAVDLYRAKKGLPPAQGAAAAAAAAEAEAAAAEAEAAKGPNTVLILAGLAIAGAIAYYLYNKNRV